MFDLHFPTTLWLKDSRNESLKLSLKSKECIDMRTDIYQKDVLSKCKLFKASTLWPNEQKIRPRAWIDNFEEKDKEIASLLLDCFIYYKNDHTDALLMSAYHSIAHLDIDLGSSSLEQFMGNAKFTVVTGEEPNPTDSGNFIIRKVRQLLKVPEHNIVPVEDAIAHAKQGGTVIFLDDFIGSGDQFIRTWQRKYGNQPQQSFEDIYQTKSFHGIYVTLVACSKGMETIRLKAPSVHVAPAHVLSQTSSVFGIELRNINQFQLDEFLTKYSARLTPNEQYIANYPHFKKYGYHGIGALMAFEHSVPDATLPIFWSPGTDDWVPLIERS